ncbi:(+)-neomenthol dehydrogenase-like [Dorcoceras hygrometricum]|uniref:(+)-neomenthol dehydrogenase-like n=1 Tax=Dorcoceras hygrometricum TaxID=472368 RepID=A0A2Z7A2N8_9LAMI|nr:(+)-neomenthol dehydrogenase-like [Dorcoceras hygrometricum]
MDIVIWTLARWAGPSPLIVYLIRHYDFIRLDILLKTLTLHIKTRRLSSLLTPPPPCAAAAAVFAGKLVSGQLDVENPIVLISSGLLVQPDEGVSDLVVDRIGVTTAIYREEPGS